jgi:hypothetical protein
MPVNFITARAANPTMIRAQVAGSGMPALMVRYLGFQCQIGSTKQLILKPCGPHGCGFHPSSTALVHYLRGPTTIAHHSGGAASNLSWRTKAQRHKSLYMRNRGKTSARALEIAAHFLHLRAGSRCRSKSCFVLPVACGLKSGWFKVLQLSRAFD